MFKDFELGEILAILLVLAIGGYVLYRGASDWFKSALCISKVGTIPGVTGATQAQACAPKIAATNLPEGGSIIWTCASDATQFDYAKACGDVVQVRHSFWGQLTGTPVTYATIARGSYARPSGGIVNPQFACCYSCAGAS